MMLRLALFSGLLFVIVAFAIPSCQAGGSFKDVAIIRQNFQNKLNSKLVQQVHTFSKSVIFYTAYAAYFDRADVDLPGFNKFFLSMSADRLVAADNLTTIINIRGGYVWFQNVKLQQTCRALSRKLKRFLHVCDFGLDQSSKQALKSNKPRKPMQRNGKRWFWNSPWSFRRKTTVKPELETTPAVPTLYSALEDTLALESSTNTDLLELMGDATSRIPDPAVRVKLDDLLERQVDLLYNLSNLVTRLRFYKDTSVETLGEYILDSELTY